MTLSNAADGQVRRIALVVSYEGTDYAGFQFQTNAPTIQGELEKAIFNLTGTNRRIRGASRTDAGAHACGQVVDFITDSALESHVFISGLNYHLPEPIRVNVACEIPLEFHARYSATFREYRYSILNRTTPSPLLRRTHHLETTPLDLTNMRTASSSLLGTRDFRQIATGHPGDKSAVRSVSRWEVNDHPAMPGVIIVDCAANGFLRYQIRKANAVLVEIGKGKLPVHAMAEALAGRTQLQRQIHTLPAKGLCLKSVRYPRYDHLLATEGQHETY